MRTGRKFIVGTGLVCLGVALSLIALRTSGQSSPALQSTIGDAVQQMQMAHEATPTGVPPSYSWQAQSVIQAGNRPPGGFHAITGWGQIFRASGAAPVTLNVSLRNFRTYLLQTSGDLQLLQSTNTLDGAQFNPDYQGNVNTPAEIGVDSNGYTSVVTNPNLAFQFWPSAGKVNFNSRNLAGIVVVVEARINPANGQAAADVDNKYILSVGADYWAAVNSVWDNYRSSAGVATGRFQFLTTEWKCFTMTTVPERNSAALPVLFAC
ncbi:hypothetical protein [Paraburkholderia susongensis]|uniref:Uncharacterized protein n=1 Tax=Paraburkholderia susongensis TaxID=1515439 RepID=A0A1X7KS05_9BURK|nr:hypothetical protein [Paraburkholderia susongensis]SMG44105.1 hypothetical protein SAMN06265784_104220 [Paraburkholderia susongensis]